MGKKKENSDELNESIEETIDNKEVSLEAEALIDSIMPDSEKIIVPEAPVRRSVKKANATRSLEKTMKILKTTRKVRFY